MERTSGTSMAVRPLVLCMLAVLCGWSATAGDARACGPYGVSPELWVSHVEQGTEGAQPAAVRELRAFGYPGLDLLAQRYEQLAGESADEATLQRLRIAMDQVAGQYLGHRSRLYWHSDIDAARAEATSSGKPILSLRMLGNLTEERSCANSRFFRAVLYVDPDVNRMLREQFVLHWSSERPVPQVTIDFGDGRTLKQTIAGNSIHYVLNAEGQPVDALPGLLAPRVFREQLQQSRQLHFQIHRISDPAGRHEALKLAHAQLADNTRQMWATNLGVARMTGEDPLHPDIVRAQIRVMSKRAVEEPLINAMSPDLGKLLADATTDEHWQRLAERQSSLFVISDATRELIAAEARENGSDPAAMIARFERMLRIDTMQNMYDLHGSIHDWFAAAESPLTFESLNTRVYSDLFLTPADDPWLGLMPMMTYAAMSSAE